MKEAVGCIETALALTMAWALVFLMPFRWTSALFGGVAPPCDHKTVDDRRQLVRAFGVMRRLDRIAGRIPWHSTCLVRAVAGQLLLVRRRIPGAVIRFGVKMTPDGMAAHAWLLVGDVTVLGGATAEEYSPLADMSR